MHGHVKKYRGAMHGHVKKYRDAMHNTSGLSIIMPVSFTSATSRRLGEVRAEYTHLNSLHKEKYSKYYKSHNRHTAFLHRQRR